MTAEPVVFLTIAMTREKVAMRRSCLASKIPEAMQASDCKNHQPCSMAWDITWLMKIAPKLVDPDDLWRATLRDVQDIVLRLEVPEMHVRCFELSVEPLRSSKAWDFEDTLVEKAIDTLMVQETDLDFTPDGDSLFS